jgi:trimethylamine:corrinoid methyltransferase-like protein
MAIATQMARHYGIPCRYGGNRTDSFSINMQTGSESAIAMATSLLCGVHFMAKIAKKCTFEEWRENNFRDTGRLANEYIQTRLNSYQKPDIDPEIEKDLRKYVDSKTK